MTSVAERVEYELMKQPFLMDVLLSGYGSIMHIARQMQPAIEAARLEKVSVATIAMALRRFALSQTKLSPAVNYPVSGIVVRTDIVHLFFAAHSPSNIVFDQILTLSHKTPDTFVSIMRGQQNVGILLSKSLKAAVVHLLNELPKTQEIANLSVISIKFPDNVYLSSGVYYPYIQALALNKISFIQIFSVGTEINFVVRDEDFPAAFAVIKNLAK